MSPLGRSHGNQQHHIGSEYLSAATRGGHQFGCAYSGVQSTLRCAECDVRSDGVSGTSDRYVPAQWNDPHLAKSANYGTTWHGRESGSRFSAETLPPLKRFGLLFSSTDPNRAELQLHHLPIRLITALDRAAPHYDRVAAVVPRAVAASPVSQTAQPSSP